MYIIYFAGSNYINMNTELSIEETNKLRLKLGLKPIAVEDSANTGKSDVIDTDTINRHGNILEPQVTRKQTIHRNLDMSDITAGEIMTLKDTDILDDEQNELITETDLLNQQLSNKQQMNNRTLHRFDEDSENGAEDGVDEAQYFQIGESKVKLRLNQKSKQREERKRLDDIAAKSNRKLVTFDDESDDNSQSRFQDAKKADFSSEKSTKFKKHKKRKLKDKKKKQLSVDEEEEDDQKEIKLEYVSLANNKEDDSVLFEDENDLQAVLASQRAIANRKKIESNIITKDNDKDGANKKRNIHVMLDESDDDMNAGGLVIDSNTEFLSTLKQSILSEQSKDSKDQEPVSNSRPLPVVSAVQTENSKLDKAESNEDIFDEPDFSGGLSATLSFLKKNSIIKVDEESEARSKQRMQQARLKNKLQLQNLKSETDEVDTMYTRNHQRAVQNKLQDYNPEINIVYTDDNHNVLNQKEAYKYLSHKFHGKGPSKKKQAKLLKNKQHASQ